MNAPDSDRRTLLAELAMILPPASLLTATEDLKPYECDGLTAYRQLPFAVALPDNEAQVIAVLRACHRLHVPVVARGAGTGLSGGATPVAGGVILSLAKFMRILGINPLARTADSSVPIAGMPILDVDQARTVVVIKRSLSPGFAGIPNPLFANDNSLMLFADAKKGVADIVAALKATSGSKH